MFDALTQYVSGSPWTYAFLFAVAALDVIIPSSPARHPSSSPACSLRPATSCLARDPLRGGRRHPRRQHGVLDWEEGRAPDRRALVPGERRKRIDWAEEQIQERGGYLILIGRFIPGGRTVVTLTCGMLEMTWHRFIRFDVVAGFLWAGYAAMLGYFGGRAFEEQPWKGFLLAFGIASRSRAGSSSIAG